MTEPAIETATESPDASRTAEPAADNLDFPLARRTGYLLQKAGALLVQDADRALGAQGIRMRYFYVLGALESGLALSQQDLSTLLNLDPTTVVALMDEMEQAGHVERRRNPVDRRRYILTLTDRGRNMLADAMSVVDQVEAEFFAPIPEKDRQRLREMLGTVLADRWPSVVACE